MNKTILWTIVLIFAFAVNVFSVNERGNKNFTGTVNLDGDFKIKGTQVTATADELNSTTGDIVQVSSVYGSATSVNGALASAQLICTNTVTMLDIAGATFADYTLTHVWMSETSNGTASASNIDDLVLTGTEVVETINHGDYEQVTPANGIMTATITATAAGTNYINIGVGPRITSTEIIFLP